MKKQLLILMTLFTAAIGYSQTFTDANFIEYTVISGTNNVEITDYDFPNGGVTVNIPSTVNYNSTTYNVTEIGDEAFLAYNSSEKITSVVIPNSVTSIGYRTFQGNLLTSVTIPDSVTQIGSLSFSENSQLTNVVLSNNLQIIAQASFQLCMINNVNIPDSVTTIKSNAFFSNNLASVTIPNNVTAIEVRAFMNNPLTCVISENTTPPTVSIAVGGNTNLDSFGGSRSNINLSIPASTANAYAAAQWTGFNSVAEGLTGTFVVDNIAYQINPSPNNEVTVTGYNTAGGTVVDIPETVISACTSFTVTDIANFSLDNINLTSLTLPNSLVNIGENAFAFNDLPSIIIPDSVVMIGDGAFAQNNNMTSVTIGSSVAIIGEYSFRFNAITSLTIPDNVITIGQLAFSSNSITNLDFGNGIETIGNQAFRYNNGLQSLTIPTSVTSIGDSAFFNITSLTDVYAEGITPPTITTSVSASDSFAADRSNIHLHIPAGTMGAYVTDPGALWTGFNPVSEDALSISDFELVNTVKIVTTEDALNIISDHSLQLQDYTLYSISGMEITTGKENNISTSTFARGIYILKLNFDKGTVVEKVIIN